MTSPVARWLCIASTLLIFGCTAGTDKQQASAVEPHSALHNVSFSGDHPGLTGVWEGISVADCIGIQIDDLGRCEATQNITLTMFQEGEKVSGYYRCAYGNQNCRDQAETGVIRNGNMLGRRLMMRVMLEDGSMCYFTGIPAGDRLDGRYSCMTSGLFEKGGFHTERSY